MGVGSGGRGVLGELGSWVTLVNAWAGRDHGWAFSCG